MSTSSCLYLHPFQKPFPNPIRHVQTDANHVHFEHYPVYHSEKINFQMIFRRTRRHSKLLLRFSCWGGKFKCQERSAPFSLFGLKGALDDRRPASPLADLCKLRWFMVQAWFLVRHHRWKHLTHLGISPKIYQTSIGLFQRKCQRATLQKWLLTAERFWPLAFGTSRTPRRSKILLETKLMVSRLLSLRCRTGQEKISANVIWNKWLDLKWISRCF